MTADTLYLDAKTEKGSALLESLSALTEACGGEDETAVERHKELSHERLSGLPLAELSADRFGADKTDAFFNYPAWKTLSEACLGCGTCTFVCPTCQCYDIQDFDTGHGVKRFRCWDSCMYSSASASGSCTSWSTIPPITTVCSPAWAADAAFPSARFR